MTIATATIRPFEPRDYEAYVRLTNESYPDYGWTVTEVRHEDENWDHSRYFKQRMVAEQDGAVVGTSDLNHSRGSFVPDNYWFEVVVRPEYRGRGIGGQLYERLEITVRERNGRILRIGVKESMADGVRFVQKRGFVETKRDWESRLDVNAFDEAPFAKAFERLAEQGVRITTLAAEMKRDPDAMRRAFELHEACRADVPSTDPITPHEFEHFRNEIQGPTSLPKAYFLALDADGRYLAESNLWASLDDPSFLWQGLTGVRREARGRGLAMALKLQGVRYAKSHGKREIKTWNDTRNRPMLRINEAMGFVKQPVWIAFEKDLRSGT